MFPSGTVDIPQRPSGNPSNNRPIIFNPWSMSNIKSGNIKQGPVRSLYPESTPSPSGNCWTSS